MRDTLMIVGNGLAIDYRNQFQQMPNPSCPLDFPLLTPETNGKLLRDTFAELWQTINNLRAEKPTLDDFSLIKCIRLMPWPSNPAHSQSRSDYAKTLEPYHACALTETQLRLHLTHAYTYFTQNFTDLELQKWRWYPWLLHNKGGLHTVVSFNYDLLIEKAIQSIVHVKYLIEGFQAFNIKPEVAVFKPHGSVNYAISKSAMYFSGDTKKIYDRKNVITLNDAPITVLKLNELVL